MARRHFLCRKLYRLYSYTDKLWPGVTPTPLTHESKPKARGRGSYRGSTRFGCLNSSSSRNTKKTKKSTSSLQQQQQQQHASLCSYFERREKQEGELRHRLRSYRYRLVPGTSIPEVLLYELQHQQVANTRSIYCCSSVPKCLLLRTRSILHSSP